MKATAHVVGAGLAGLSAALALLEAGWHVILWESARQAGGRCRSYHDPKLGCQIDNGNHLVLSGNRSVAAYLARAGASDALVAAPAAHFPFVDLASAERWTVRINDGPIPWWPLCPARRPAGVGARAFLSALPLLWAGPDQTIAEAVQPGGLAASRFWEPMSLAVMNLPPSLASAQLMAATAREAWRDGRLCRPMFAPRGLGPALIAPALDALQRAGAELRFAAQVKGLVAEGGRVTALHVAGETVPLAPGDTLVLAVPPARLNALWPAAQAPEEASSILNAHFRLPQAVAGPPLLGVTGARTQWIFVKSEVVSLTISAAGFVEGTDAEEEALLTLLWAETVAALGLAEDVRPVAARLVHERRATFLQTPANVRRRARPLTGLANLVLAGDHIDTGLPATIEGAVRSGETAARLLGKPSAEAGAASGSAR